MKTLPLGKLPFHLLADLLPTLPSDPRVILGPRPGEDAAVIEMPDRYLVAKTDPVTFATDAVGWYAVQVNANDIATTGAVPLWFLATVLLPRQTATEQMARAIFGQINEACRSIDVAVVGGHTEITYDLNRPIVVGCMLGEVDKHKLVRTGGAQLGDIVLLTKGAPVEGVAILAREKREHLQAHFSSTFLDRCAAFLVDPGIGVVRDARIAVESGGITSMHDPTEGGVLGALWELGDASGCALEVDLYGPNKPWLAEGEALCEVFGLDPASTIASGALLLTVKPSALRTIMEAYHQAGIPVYQLGQVTAGKTTVTDRTKGLLTRPDRDAIARLFE